MTVDELRTNLNELGQRFLADPDMGELHLRQTLVDLVTHYVAANARMGDPVGLDFTKILALFPAVMALIATKEFQAVVALVLAIFAKPTPGPTPGPTPTPQPGPTPPPIPFGATPE